MQRLQRRMSLLYGVLALGISLACIVAAAAIALLIIDRNLALELHAVAARVSAVARTATGATFVARASDIITRTRVRDVEVTVGETSTGEQFMEHPFGDGGFPGGDGPPPDDGGPPGGFGGHPPPAPVTASKTSGDTAPFALSALFAIPPESVPIPGGNVGIFPSASHLRAIAVAFVSIVVVALVLALVSALIVGRLMAARALKPLAEVVAELHRFGTGDFATRTVDATSDGYEELAAAYNAAAEQVRSALSERTKAETDMRRFIADAAHELRTPLTVVTGYVELLRSGIDRASQEQIFATIDIENRRMRELISKLLALARLDAPHVAPFQAVNLSSIVEAAIDESASLVTTNDVHVDIRTGAKVFCDPNDMHDALTNLLANAGKYAPGSALHVSLKQTERHAILEIADEGPGMTAIDRDNAFRRFYRGESHRDIEGSGLGLSIVERVVTRARGTIALATAPGSGTRFTIVLPIASS